MQDKYKLYLLLTWLNPYSLHINNKRAINYLEKLITQREKEND